MVVAETAYGRVEGYEDDAVKVFKGIRYAAPPRRWRRSGPPEPWGGVSEATRVGSIAPQILAERRLFSVETPPQSEDCLFLNVWTPAADGGRRPVMVWIHGGAFTGGNGGSEVYDGKSLASRGDVVVVTINYRLGVLGFLRLNEVTSGAIPSSGNEGMLDQVLALEWVQQNIERFGGDPGNVTIFGESAGGMSVGCHLAMPDSGSLFHKAIAQSGACHNAQPAMRANTVAERLLHALEIDPGDVDALMNVSTEALLAGHAKFIAESAGDGAIGGLPFQPVVDGTVIPEHPIQCLRGGSAQGKPVMSGATAEEWKLFLSMNPADSILDEESLYTRLGRAISRGRLDHVIDVYTQGLTDREMNATPTELFSAINTDRVFRIPGIRLCETQLQHSGLVFSYGFDWRSPLAGMGACHALELPFVFGTFDREGVSSFAGSGPDAARLSEDMQEAWLAFAREGTPGGAWPSYAKNRATKIFGRKTRVEEDPRSRERRVWEGMDRALGVF